MSLRRLLGLIGEVYEARRVRGAARHRVIGAHIFPLDALLVPYFAGEAEFVGERRGLRRERHGIDHVARFVRDIARPALGLRHDLAAGDPLLAAIDDDDRLGGGESVLFILLEIFAETVTGKHRALGRRAGASFVLRTGHRYRKGGESL